jgi:hypothetical protein
MVMEMLHLEFLARCADARPYTAVLERFIELARDLNVIIVASEDPQLNGASSYEYNRTTGADRYVRWFVGRARDRMRFPAAVAIASLAHEMGHVCQHRDGLNPPDAVAPERVPWEEDAWSRARASLVISPVILPIAFWPTFEEERARGIASYARARVTSLSTQQPIDPSNAS